MLLPYHKFDYDGNAYLLNVEHMTAGRIGERASAALDRISSDADAPVPAEILEELNQLGLVIDEARSAGEGSETKTRHDDAEEGATVRDIALFVSQRCNLRCVYCYGAGGEYGRRGMMDEATALRAVDWLIRPSEDHDKLRISLFGGEPLLNFPLMQRVVEYARKRGAEVGKSFRFNVTTNGTLLDDEKIAFFKTNNIYVSVSFDGPSDVQDANRPFRNGKGSYDRVSANIARLLRGIPRANVYCRATLHGSADPARVAEAIRGLGASMWLVTEASPPILDGHTGVEDDAREPSRVIELVQAEAIRALAAIKNRDWEGLKEIDRFSGFAQVLEYVMYKQRRPFFCGAGRTYLGVSTSGDLFPCHRFAGLDEYKLGSIFDGNVDSRGYQASPTGDGGPCSECWAKYYCGGGCVYDHLARTGSTSKPAETCGICWTFRASLELAIYVWCELDESDRNYMKYARILRGGMARWPFKH